MNLVVILALVSCLTLFTLCNSVSTTGSWDLTFNATEDATTTTAPMTTTIGNCGALYVSVEITTPPAYAGTYVSANVLFPPYSYSLNETEVVGLEDDDDICTGVLSDYTGYVVLIEVDEDTCSAQYQVYMLEQAGAVGVLFANTQDNTQVYQLDVDDSSEDPTIPARMISQIKGEDLFTAMDVNAGTILVEMLCEEGTYAQSVCVYDGDSDHWEVDGDYEAQTSIKVHGHHVWLKEGYSTVYSDYYIYLDIEDSSGIWRWTLSNEYENSTTKQDVGYCNITYSNETIDPSVCEGWVVIEYDDNGNVESYLSGDLIVDDSICAISDNYFCLISQQTSMRNYEGTYHQVHENITIWTRELDSSNDDHLSHMVIDMYEKCSTTNSFPSGSTTTCTNYTGFILYDEDGDYQAVCDFDGESYTKPIECETWEIVSTRNSGGGPGGSSETEYSYSTDNTWDIDDGWCEGYSDQPNTTINFDSYPEYLCLSDLSAYNDNGTIVYNYHDHQYLYGTWKRMENEAFGSLPVWTSVRLQNTSYDSYIFIDDYDDIWVMDGSIPDDIDDVSSNPDGECETDNINDPSLCTDCWEIDNTQSCKQWNFTIGECDGFSNTLAPNDRSEYLDYICLTFQESSSGGGGGGNNNNYDTDANGLYVLSDDLYNDRYYYTFTNTNTSDGENKTYHIYYFKLLRYWVFSEGFLDYDDDDYDLYCEEYNNFNLVNCSWSAASGGGGGGSSNQYNWEIHSCPNGSYSTYEESAPTQPPASAPNRFTTTDADRNEPRTDDQDDLSSSNGVIVALSVTLGIVVLILVVIGVMYLMKRNKGQAGFGGGFAEEVNDGNLGGLPLSDLKDHNETGGATAGGTYNSNENEPDEPDDDDDDNDDNDDNDEGPDDDEDGALPVYTGGDTGDV